MSHRYYSPLRPLSLGTFLKPQGNEILHIENFEERQNVPEIARQAWGYIEYKEALTEIEAAAYELIPSNCISEMENIEASPQAFCLMKYQRRAFFACSRCRLCSFFCAYLPLHLHSLSGMRPLLSMPLLPFFASLPFGGALCLSMCAALLFWRLVLPCGLLFALKSN